MIPRFALRRRNRREMSRPALCTERTFRFSLHDRTQTHAHTARLLNLCLSWQLVRSRSAELHPSQNQGACRLMTYLI